VKTSSAAPCAEWLTLDLGAADQATRSALGRPSSAIPSSTPDATLASSRRVSRLRGCSPRPCTRLRRERILSVTPLYGEVGSECHGAARMVIPSMLTLASTGRGGPSQSAGALSFIGLPRIRRLPPSSAQLNELTRHQASEAGSAAPYMPPLPYPNPRTANFRDKQPAHSSSPPDELGGFATAGVWLVFPQSRHLPARGQRGSAR
jgi:hypothetical protein